MTPKVADLFRIRQRARLSSAFSLRKVSSILVRVHRWCAHQLRPPAQRHCGMGSGRSRSERLTTRFESPPGTAREVCSQRAERLELSGQIGRRRAPDCLAKGGTGTETLP